MKKLTLLMLGLVFAAVSCKSIWPKSSSSTPENTSRSASRSTAGKRAEAVQSNPEILNSKISGLAGQITSYLQNYNTSDKTVVVTTFVNIDELKTGGRFGRYVSEQLAHQLHIMGYHVFEIRQAKAIRVVENQGEFYLTRKSEELLDSYHADAVLVGTYSVMGNQVVVHARMVDGKTSRIVSVGSIIFKTEEDPYLGNLLSSGEPDESDERMAEGLHIREMAPDKITNPGQMLEQKMDGFSHKLARHVTRNSPTMVVATFVDMDRLNRSETFGRFMAENMMGRMAKLGFNVVEARTAKRLMVQPNVGQHALTDQDDEMQNAYKADSVLLGTYKKTGDRVVVYARLVAHGTQMVISSAEMDMDIEKDDAFLRGMFDNALERVGNATGSYDGMK